MTYEYVTLDDPRMKFAYTIAKAFYSVNKWNLKAMPVAVACDGMKVLSFGVSGNGRHQLDARCDRLDTKGSDYDTCVWCAEEEHAERKALEGLEWASADTMLIYGHYRMCDVCIRTCKRAGIVHFILMKDSSILFNRHHKDTVIGTTKQFKH